MRGLILASTDEAWSYGGSIMTFLLPMILFVTVAIALYVIYTKPELVPGRRPSTEISMAATRVPGMPAEDQAASNPAGAASGSAEQANGGKLDKPASVE